MVVPDWLDDIESPIASSILSLLRRIMDLEDPINLTEMQLKPSEKAIIEELGSSLNRFDLYMFALSHHHTLDEICKYINWHHFELLIAATLKYVGWVTQTNLRFFSEGIPSERRRFEVDIIAHHHPYVLLIDCKRYKNTGQATMKTAARIQKRRVYELIDMVPYIHDMTGLEWAKWERAMIIPCVITWKEHGLHAHDGVLISSSAKLSDVITNLEKYIDELNIHIIYWNGVGE